MYISPSFIFICEKLDTVYLYWGLLPEDWKDLTTFSCGLKLLLRLEYMSNLLKSEQILKHQTFYACRLSKWLQRKNWASYTKQLSMTHLQVMLNATQTCLILWLDAIIVWSKKFESVTIIPYFLWNLALSFGNYCRLLQTENQGKKLCKSNVVRCVRLI